MKAVIIGTSGHIDLALGVRDRATGVSFVGVAPGSPDEDARSFFVDQLEASLIPWYDDWRTMLDRERPDLAVIAPFFHLQSAVARECLQRGIHAFVEKPMATSLEDLAALRAAYAAGRAKLCPMLAYRYHPAFQAAWLAVKEGLVGEPLVVTAQKSYKLGTRHRMYTRRGDLRRHHPLGGRPRHRLAVVVHEGRPGRGRRRAHHGGQPGPRGAGELGRVLLPAGERRSGEREL